MEVHFGDENKTSPNHNRNKRVQHASTARWYPPKKYVCQVGHGKTVPLIPARQTIGIHSHEHRCYGVISFSVMFYVKIQFIHGRILKYFFFSK